MQVINSSKSLAEAISNLENEHQTEENILKEHFKFTIHSLNPLNMMKEKYNDLLASPHLKNKFIQGSIGLLAGLLTNNFILGSSSTILKKVFETTVLTGVSKVPLIDSIQFKRNGISFLQNILSKMKINS